VKELYIEIFQLFVQSGLGRCCELVAFKDLLL